MGIGFTVDSALKVARFGIDSVMSLSGQPLQEKLRKFYSDKYGIAYEAITEKADDYRAQRTKAYLNLLNDMLNITFEEFKNSPARHKDDIEKHIDMLPDSANMKKEFQDLLAGSDNADEFKTWVEANLRLGSIDVNIMTKLDKENYVKGRSYLLNKTTDMQP